MECPILLKLNFKNGFFKITITHQKLFFELESNEDTSH